MGFRRFRKTQENTASFLIIIIVLSGVCVLLSSTKIPTVRAFDTLQREWVTLEIQTFAKDNILIKLNAVTSGNNLNQSMWIISSTPSTSSGVSNIISFRFVLEAQYSADTNTTTFTCVLSPAQYVIQQVGDFPNDKWNITIELASFFNVTFDPGEKFCVTPSSNYYGIYTTVPVSGEQDYLVNLEILHASSFACYVDTVFLLPIVLLAMLILACIAIAVYIGLTRRKIPNKFYNSFITICSAVIVFIPIFQLSTQELKMPNLFTSFDWAFIILLITYIGFLVGLLIVKALAKGSNQEKPPQSGSLIDYEI